MIAHPKRSLRRHSRLIAILIFILSTGLNGCLETPAADDYSTRPVAVELQYEYTVVRDGSIGPETFTRTVELSGPRTIRDAHGAELERYRLSGAKWLDRDMMVVREDMTCWRDSERGCAYTTVDHGIIDLRVPNGYGIGYLQAIQNDRFEIWSDGSANQIEHRLEHGDVTTVHIESPIPTFDDRRGFTGWFAYGSSDWYPDEFKKIEQGRTEHARLVDTKEASEMDPADGPPDGPESMSVPQEGPLFPGAKEPILSYGFSLMDAHNALQEQSTDYAVAISDGGCIVQSRVRLLGDSPEGGMLPQVLPRSPDQRIEFSVAQPGKPDRLYSIDRTEASDTQEARFHDPRVEVTTLDIDCEELTDWPDAIDSMTIAEELLSSVQISGTLTNIGLRRIIDDRWDAGKSDHLYLNYIPDWVQDSATGVTAYTPYQIDHDLTRGRVNTVTFSPDDHERYDG